jgi:hypothetical protein
MFKKPNDFMSDIDPIRQKTPILENPIFPNPTMKPTQSLFGMP